eukprot:scaffold2047_cov129-Cylindrotheca_fusiformis.AAC.30
MLRQALDAANGQQEQASAEGSTSVDETEPLINSLSDQGYDTNNNDNEADDSESRSSDEDEDYSVLQNWQDDNTSEGSEAGFLERTWKAIKELVMLIINVDNLWDSPTSRQVIRKKKVVVLFWFFILASFYAVERTTFKFLVDRSGPFRLVSVEVIAASHAIMVAIGMLITAISTKNFKITGLGIPIIDVGCEYQLLDSFLTWFVQTVSPAYIC